MEVMAVLGWAAFGIVLLAAVPAQVAGLPGTWIIFADAFVLRFLDGETRIGWTTVAVLGLIAASGEILEFTTAVAGARSQDPVKGTTAAAVVGAIVGGIAGVPFLFGIGAIPGMAVGAFLAVFILYLAGGRGAGEAWSAGYGALIGRLKGTAVKVLMSAAMLIFLIVSLFI